MAVSTIYDIKVNYKFANKGAAAKIAVLSKKTEKLARSTKKAKKAYRSLGTEALAFAAKGAVVVGMVRATRAAVDFTNQIEQAKIATAGLLQLNVGGEFQENLQNSRNLVKAFQKDAISSTATTLDFVNFSKLTAGPITRGGGSVNDIRDITSGAVIAAKAFNVAPEVAALDIEQALAGTLKSRDRFARALLEPLGINTVKWNKMIRSTPKKALVTLKRALKQEGLKKMAEEQRVSLAGVTSTFVDNMQRFMGAISGPGLDSFRKGLMGINSWMQRNNHLVTSFTDNFGEAMKFVGTMLTSVVLPAVKVIGGTLVVLMDMIRTLTTGEGLDILAHNFVSVWKFAGKLVTNTMLEALASFTDMMRGMTEGMINAAVFAINKITSIAQHIPGFGKIGKLSEVHLDDNNASFLRQLKKNLKIGPDLKDFRKKAVEDFLLPGERGGRDGRDRVTPPNNFNVNISRIEVASDDPDRFAFQLVHAFEDINKNPTQAAAAIGEF